MSSSTAIIVGGGVIGLSTAYHLAKRRYGKIILLEKGQVGDGSSSRAAGIITGLLWSETGVLARKRAFELYAELSRELVGYKYQNVGCLNLFDPHSWHEREPLLAMYKRCGAPFEIISNQEIQKRWPQLTPGDQFMGLHDPRGGFSEPDEYLPAITKKIRELGVEIFEHQAVADFLVRNGRIVGVKTNVATFEGDAVVCTVYAWTLPLLERLSYRLPVKTFVHQRYVTKPLAAPVAIPAVNANPLLGYVRPARGNRLLLGIETTEREEYRIPSRDWQMSVTADPIWKDSLRASFGNIVPALKDTPWETEKVGLLTFSMDGEPILGPIEQLPGLYVGVAFHSGGFAYNPVAGQLLAEHVMDGRTSIDIRTFSPNRFDPKQVDEYLATTVAQKDSIRRRH
jgi:glycine/D-amino acid oxidase-like deaminating enzyme